MPLPNNTCEHCGGSELISGLTVSASGGGGDVRPGLLCKAKGEGFFDGPEKEKRETLFADLCTSCGTVKRFYVKDPKRDWVVELLRFTEFVESVEVLSSLNPHLEKNEMGHPSVSRRV